MEIQPVEQYQKQLSSGIEALISRAKQQVALSLNKELTLLYWSIGAFILSELQHQTYQQYGKQILTNLSQNLSQKHGKGYSYSALTRMIKVAKAFDRETIATLSQQLSWSHLIELSHIIEVPKRHFYQHMAIQNNWSVRALRNKQAEMLFERTVISQKDPEQIIATLEETKVSPDLVFKSSYILDFLELSGYYSEKDLEEAIVAQLEKFILELGAGFAFIERQKRISIDSTDYYLDLLFYHRRLNCLVVIDLKLGKFKPQHKSQMELYLRYLQKFEKQPHENDPIGLLLCSEGNSEHIELLMLDEANIKVAQYLTELPNRQWFIDKLQRAISIAHQHRSK